MDKLCGQQAILTQEKFRNSPKTLPGVNINSGHVLSLGQVDNRLKRIRGRQETMKLVMEKFKYEEERRKFLRNFQEKATNLETLCGNSNEHWIHLKRCIQTSAQETIGYKEIKNVKKHWVTGKMLEKMEERRKWKNINTEEATRNCRKLNNERRQETNKAKEEWMKQKCEEIEKLERKGRYDLIYREVKSLDYGNKSRKGMWLIEDENNEEITDKQGILNTWQKYVEELYETRNRQAILDIENETDIPIRRGKRIPNSDGGS